MRRKGELENVGEDKNTIINKTFCEQYSKFQQEYTLGIPILMNLQYFASRWNPLLSPPSSHKSSSSSPTLLQYQHQELLPSPLQLKDETMRKKRERLCFISPL
jgi:hypothetical protein